MDNIKEDIEKLASEMREMKMQTTMENIREDIEKLASEMREIKMQMASGK